jgi:hypothetical protein
MNCWVGQPGVRLWDEKKPAEAGYQRVLVVELAASLSAKDTRN